MATWSLEGGYGNFYVSFLECEGAVDWYAKKIHGIDEGKLAGAPSLLSLWPEVNGRLGNGAVPVAHAKGTEKRFLRKFPGNPFEPWVDTLLLARAALPDSKKHSLGVFCEDVGVAEKVRVWFCWSGSSNVTGWRICRCGRWFRRTMGHGIGCGKR
jgi:DNA polymerase-3 subunit epsilon